MPWDPGVYSLLAIAGAGISFAVALQVWRLRDQRGAITFLGLILAVTGWTFVSGIQLGFSTGAEQQLWQQLGLAIGGTIPTLWVIFTLVYTGQTEWLSRRMVSVLAIEPILFALLVLSNSRHGFVFEISGVTETAAGTVPVVVLGAGYYLHMIYSYMLVAAGIGFLLIAVARTPDVYRTRSTMLICGTVPTLFANAIFSLQLSWGPFPGLDPTPLALLLTAGVFGLAVFQFDLLDRTPIARKRLLDEMGDGMIVLDPDGSIRDANEIATEILDLNGNSEQPLTTIEYAEGDSSGEILDSLDGSTITESISGREQTYDISCSVLTDNAGDVVGYVISFRNVTERRRYEQRLEVTQRVLRHNLRNDINVIRAYADLIEQNGETDPEQAAQQIIATTEDLASVSDKTRLITHIERMAELDPVMIDVHESLLELVADLESEYPEATIECEIPDAMALSISDKELFTIPMTAIIENAIEHSRSEPWVRVTAERTGGLFSIAVADRGPTIPAVERDVLEQEREEQLQHGSGIGLWLAHWSVKTAGGTLSFASREPQGNVVTLTFPAAKTPTTATSGPE